jgi:hypothetical protein
VLLNIEPDTAVLTPGNYGQNLKKFSHLFFRAGSVVSQGEGGLKIKYITSADFGLGIRNKYKLSAVYSMGWETMFEYTDYKFSKNKMDSLYFGTGSADRQRLDYSSFSLGYFNRFNFDPRRGNYMGKFLDLGINGQVHYVISHIRKYLDGTTIIWTAKNPSYASRLNANAFMRFGFGRLSLFGTYRLTNAFKEKYNIPELPRIIAGLEIGLY